MPSVRTMYTREELLRIATLASAMNLGPEVLRKFDVIEIADPVPAPKRREPEPNSKASVFTDNFSTSTANSNVGHNTGGHTTGKANHSTGINGGGNNSHTGNSNTQAYGSGGGRGGDSRRGGGGHGGRDENNSTSSKQPGYDRFAPPEGRFSRGNRNQETFEEGVQYELRQSALQKKRVAETMEREDRKGEHLRQALEKFKQEGNATEAAEAEKKETDEIERLLAGISMVDEAPKTVARSRFFSAQAPTAANTQPTAATQPPPPPQASTTSPFGLSGSCSSPVSAGAPQASVLATPANNGTPGYVAGPWSSMKSDPNLWSTAPSMASALKQSLQQPLAPVTTSLPAQIKPPQPASQQSQAPANSPRSSLSTKSMGVGAAPTAVSAHSTSGQLASGLGSFGVSAPASKSLPVPLQSSVQGPSNGNGGTNIAAGMNAKAGDPGNARQPQTPPQTPPLTPPYTQSQPSRPEATTAKAAQRSGVSTTLPSGTWSAADLELLLKNGATLISSAPAPQSQASTTAPKMQPISAAELENMLMQRARQGSGTSATGMTAMPPSPPQFPQSAPQQQQTMLPFSNSGKAPHIPASSSAAAVPRSPPQQHPTGMKMVPSGAMLPPPPPMPSQIPGHPQHSTQQLQTQQQQQQQQAQSQQQQPPWMAMPRLAQAPPPPQPNGGGSSAHSTPPQQPLAAKIVQTATMMPNGLQMPMRMNAPGQYFVDPAQLQRVYMSSQPMMFRRPDGTVFMQAQSMPPPQPHQVLPQQQQQQQQPPFNPFGTNAQFLFQQQQHR
ncbi:hypothetical protein JKF63_01398 [Porcisia hertigi]|uniref:4E-interacting protein n=1 Tax=Porcisia hertigi TaxID=2761500 RepID=A0A836L9X7_9TRYP|nr:hypothetical protein JKF63_01398 [Porcisia hertigi]